MYRVSVGIILSTSGLEVVFPLKQWSSRRWVWIDRVSQNPELFVSVEDGVLNEFEMMCQIRILPPLHFVVFKQTECHLTTETYVEQVFSQSGQLSKVNLDPDTLADMNSVIRSVYQG